MKGKVKNMKKVNKSVPCTRRFLLYKPLWVVFSSLCTSVQSFLVGFKNDWYGGLRQPTLPDCCCFMAQRPQKVKPSKIPVFSVLLLALLGYCFEFCRPGRSKKYRCLCVCAKTVFAISTPVSFLCYFSFPTLSPKDGGNAVSYGKIPYFMFFKQRRKVHRVHLLFKMVFYKIRTTAFSDF